MNLFPLKKLRMCCLGWRGTRALDLMGFVLTSIRISGTLLRWTRKILLMILLMEEWTMEAKHGIITLVQKPWMLNKFRNPDLSDC